MIDYFTEMFGPAFGPVIGLAIIMVLIALGIWVLFFVIRRFRSGLFVSGGSKTRVPRLAVTDAVPVDSHRRLVLVRCDDVEHLIMIGGPTDIVVEAGIGKPQQVIPAAQPRQQISATPPATPPAPPAPPLQRTPVMAARDAVTEAERGRPVRTVESQLPERRSEAPFIPPAPPPVAAPASAPQLSVSAPAAPPVVVAPPATPPIQVQAPQAMPSAPAVQATPAAAPRSASDIELDKLLDELRPNSLRDR